MNCEKSDAPVLSPSSLEASGEGLGVRGVQPIPPSPFPTKEGGVRCVAPLSLQERGRGRGQDFPSLQRKEAFETRLPSPCRRGDGGEVKMSPPYKGRRRSNRGSPLLAGEGTGERLRLPFPTKEGAFESRLPSLRRRGDGGEVKMPPCLRKLPYPRQPVQPARPRGILYPPAQRNALRRDVQCHQQRQHHHLRPQR